MGTIKVARGMGLLCHAGERAMVYSQCLIDDNDNEYNIAAYIIFKMIDIIVSSMITYFTSTLNSNCLILILLIFLHTYQRLLFDLFFITLRLLLYRVYLLNLFLLLLYQSYLF